MKGGDRRGSPRLPFCTILLRPDNRLPIGIENECSGPLARMVAHICSQEILPV